MSTLSLKRAFSPFFLTSLFALFVASSVASKPARAFGGLIPSCGTMCMASYGPMFSPFMNMPMFPMTPGYGMYYQTGQWGNPMMQDPRYAMAMSLNWNGTQPLGLSYMPPIGMSAIQNNMAASAMGF